MARKKKAAPEEGWPELIIRVRVDTDPAKVYPADVAAALLAFDEKMNLPKFKDKGTKFTAVEWNTDKAEG